MMRLALVDRSITGHRLLLETATFQVAPYCVAVVSTTLHSNEINTAESI